MGPECGRLISPTGGVAGGPPWTWGGGLARSWAQTVTRASGGGGGASSSSCLQSAEGFEVQHAEVHETGGEPASAEWFGRQVIGDCGDCGMAALITTALILLNKNVYMFADVSSGSVLEV
eukprot:COSAG01_NODE_2636_length_7330_cov_3.975384_3_plen_120_part_00